MKGLTNMKFILYASLLSLLFIFTGCSSNKTSIPLVKSHSTVKQKITKTVDSMSGKALYDEGQKVWYDNPLKSFELNVESANKGYVESNAVIGRLYEEGRGGVTQSNKLAIKYYKRGASRGDSHAKYKLARIYVFGKGVERKYSEALRLYLEVVNAKDYIFAYNAENEIGYMYMNALGVQKDLNKAEFWFRQSNKHQPSEIASDNLFLVKKMRKQ